MRGRQEREDKTQGSTPFKLKEVFVINNHIYKKVDRRTVLTMKANERIEKTAFEPVDISIAVPKANYVDFF